MCLFVGYHAAQQSEWTHSLNLAASPARHPPRPLQAPQWVLDACHQEQLLMPVVHPDPPAGAADDSGTLVLASLEAVSHAYEAEGSRLSPSLLLSLSREVSSVGMAGLVQGRLAYSWDDWPPLGQRWAWLGGREWAAVGGQHARAPSCTHNCPPCRHPHAQVAPFSSARELSFAANDDASLVAWVDCGRLWVKWQHTGAMHPIWPRPAEEHALLQEQRVVAQQAAIDSSVRGSGGGGSGGPPIESAPWIDRGAVLAMQWSPNGRRLLFLLHAGPSRERFARGLAMNVGAVLLSHAQHWVHGPLSVPASSLIQPHHPPS